MYSRLLRQLLNQSACAVLVVSCLVLAKAAIAQSPTPAQAPARADAHDYLKAGDAAFRLDNYSAAELEYRRAAQREPSYRAYYNLGLALARQERTEEAARAFDNAQRLAETADQKGNASFNGGTASIAAEKLEESVKQYIEALRANPNDQEAKENLAQVLRYLRVQEQQQQQQQQQEENAEEQEGEPEQSEQESDSEQQQGEPEESKQQEDEPAPSDPKLGNEDETGEGAGEPARDLDREEAERLLDMAREQEKQTQERMKLGDAKPRQPTKDW